MVLPGSILIIQLFRKAGEKPRVQARAGRQKSFVCTDNNVGQNYGSSTTKKKTKKFSFPWWTIYIAYVLSFALVTASVWCTVEVAGAFGPEKAQQWLISFLTSFAESLFLSQPIKVLLLAIFFALVIKKPPAEGDTERDPSLKREEAFMRQYATDPNDLSNEYLRKLGRYRDIPLPPTAEYIKAARLQRKKEFEMKDIIREILTYVVFVAFLLMVGFGNSDQRMHQHYRNMFATYSTGLTNPAFRPLPFTSSVWNINQVSAYEHFWSYLEETLLKTLYGRTLYDGRTRSWAQNFTLDLQNILIGPVRLRQLRINKGRCPVFTKVSKDACVSDYSEVIEDTKDYRPSWSYFNHTATYHQAPTDIAWHYRSGGELDSITYASRHATYRQGGFAIELDNNLDQAAATIAYLKSNGWVDHRTRAVFVEFNLYNGNVNLNAVSFILFEFLASGNVKSQFEIKPFRLDRYSGDFLFTIVTQFLLVVYVVYFSVKEVKLIQRLKTNYLKNPWNVYELVTLTACYGWIFLEAARIGHARALLFAYRTDKNKYVNLQSAANWNEIINDYCGLIIFATTLKMTKLLRFNTRIVTILKTFAIMGSRIASFMAVFLIVFTAFGMTSCVVFVNQLYGYSSFLLSCETLISMMLNKFNFMDLIQANAFMAVLIFVGFVVFINFIMLNFMMSLIMESFSLVKQETLLQKNKYELVNYVKTTIKALVGVGKQPEAAVLSGEAQLYIPDTRGELYKRVEELLDKLLNAAASDPQQKRLISDIEQQQQRDRENSAHDERWVKRVHATF